MAKDRIYFVGAGNTERLVRATRGTAALRHVAEDTYTVRLATQNDLEALLAKGVKVETAEAPPPEPAAQGLLATHT